MHYKYKGQNHACFIHTVLSAEVPSEYVCKAAGENSPYNNWYPHKYKVKYITLIVFIVDGYMAHFCLAQTMSFTEIWPW